MAISREDMHAMLDDLLDQGEEEIIGITMVAETENQIASLIGGELTYINVLEQINKMFLAPECGEAREFCDRSGHC